MKRFVWPQYLVEPQYIEGYFEGGVTVNLLLLSPAGLSRAYASSYDEIVKSQFFSSLPFLRTQESSYYKEVWTPAFAGATDFGLFTRLSSYLKKA